MIVLEDVIEVEEGHEHHIVESVEVSFEPQPLLWTQMESIIPPVEVQPVRSILGERLLNKNEEVSVSPTFTLFSSHLLHFNMFFLGRYLILLSYMLKCWSYMKSGLNFLPP